MWTWEVVLDMLLWWIGAGVLGGVIGIFYGAILKPTGIKIKNTINNIFKSIIQSIEGKNKFGLYAWRTFFIVFPIWLGIEVGGDWYSFDEVLWGGLWILLGIAVIVKLAFPSE